MLAFLGNTLGCRTDHVVPDPGIGHFATESEHLCEIDWVNGVTKG